MAHGNRRGVGNWLGAASASASAAAKSLSASSALKAPVSAFAVAAALLLFVVASSSVFVQAADPGHPAANISSGAFEIGNYTFKENSSIGVSL